MGLGGLALDLSQLVLVRESLGLLLLSLGSDLLLEGRHTRTELTLDIFSDLDLVLELIYGIASSLESVTR